MKADSTEVLSKLEIFHCDDFNQDDEQLLNLKGYFTPSTSAANI